MALLHCCTIGLLHYCAIALVLSPGCGLFEPREPEPPSQSSLNYRPPTDPAIVISNLQSAIEQKNAANYIACFCDPVRTSQPFVFFPAADAQALYGSVLQDWSRSEEESYFQNLIARSAANAFSSLTLVMQSSSVTADSVTYSYEYTLVFEHSDPSFPKTGKGVLWFTLRPDNTNFWAIYRWSDFSTQTAVSWSNFKGKFSN